MKKEFRVTRNEDFQKIIYHKHSVASKQFIVYYMKNNVKHMRVGISVSKKLGNAVFRNKAKRQVRELVNIIFENQVSYDFIIIVRKDFIDKIFNEKKNDLEFLWKKVKNNLR